MPMYVVKEPSENKIFDESRPTFHVPPTVRFFSSLGSSFFRSCFYLDSPSFFGCFFTSTRGCLVEATPYIYIAVA